MSFSTKLLSRRIEDEKRIGILGEGNNGIFSVPSVEPGWDLIIICSDGTEDLAEGEQRDWEHVSISTRQLTKTRMPTWKEMQFVKTLCWDDDDTVVQFHPKKSQYINVHPYVLHMWRWKKGEFPMPPLECV